MVSSYFLMILSNVIKNFHLPCPQQSPGVLKDFKERKQFAIVKI